jgi:hypothetical protein
MAGKCGDKEPAEHHSDSIDIDLIRSGSELIKKRVCHED